MSSIPETVAVHPIVLLSVVDHYYRLAKETSRRVVGALLGEIVDDKIDVTNCYALPFEEDQKDTKEYNVLVNRLLDLEKKVQQTQKELKIS